MVECNNSLVDSEMRSVAFVEHQKYEIHGTICTKAITLGDVDNDGANELITGSILGELAVFKGNKRWWKCTDLGIINTVAVGDVLNNNSNVMLVITLEGSLFVFVVKTTTNGEEMGEMVKQHHRQHVAPNGRMLMVADIDGDGRNEVIIGFSDRKVQSYRWMQVSDTAGYFLHQETWQLAGQLGSLVTSISPTSGQCELLVSQPGGAFATLTPSQLLAGDNTLQDSVTYHPLASALARNAATSTEIVAPIRGRSSNGDAKVYSAVCTLDGNLTLLDGDRTVWSICVDHELFALAAIDLLHDGTDQVVACATDGSTYIVSTSQHIVKFQLGEGVLAFCAGYFAVNSSVDVPCLIYVTLDNRLVVYPNVQIGHMEAGDLVDRVRRTPLVHSLYEQLGLNCDSMSNTSLATINNWCLYKFVDCVNKQ